MDQCRGLGFGVRSVHIVEDLEQGEVEKSGPEQRLMGTRGFARRVLIELKDWTTRERETKGPRTVSRRLGWTVVRSQGE